MSEAITTTYGGVDIAYNEDENKWEFELRGRFYSVDTLAVAKHKIDSRPKVKREFQRFEALRAVRYGKELYETVVVTSYAGADGWRNTDEFWITCNGKREKEQRDSLLKASAKNKGLIQQEKELTEQSNTIDKQIEALRKQMERIDVPADS